MQKQEINLQYLIERIEWKVSVKYHLNSVILTILIVSIFVDVNDTDFHWEIMVENDLKVF